MKNKEDRYNRIFKQLNELVSPCNDPISRMATIVAVLHHKMDYFFWTGFYLLRSGKLLVGPYQGSLACVQLKKNTGVCWTGINRKETVIVDDVEQFPGHITCDSRSRSEIVIPLFDEKNEISGVLDVDSKDIHSFDQVDANKLNEIVNLVYT